MFATSSSVDSESIWTEMTSASSSAETDARPEEAVLLVAGFAVVVVGAGVEVEADAEPELPPMEEPPMGSTTPPEPSPPFVCEVVAGFVVAGSVFVVVDVAVAGLVVEAG